MENLKASLEKDIYKIVQELKKCTNKTRYFKLVTACDDLSTLAFLKDININVPDELEYELNKKDLEAIDESYTKLLFDNINHMYSYNRKICKMLNKFDIKSFYQRSYNNKISFNENLALAKDFFENYDETLYRYFNKLINSSNFFTINQINENCGMTYRSNEIVKPYVYVSPLNNIVDYLTIIHETIHAYLFENQRYLSPNEQFNDEVNNFQEVYSSFIELLGIKYLNDIRYNKEDINNLKDNNEYSLIEKLLDFEDNLYDEFSYELYTTSEAYAYASILSYHFYNQYRQNKELAKQNILDFMLESKNHNKLYMLDNYGLNKNDIINSQKLKKYMKNFRNDLEIQ